MHSVTVTTTRKRRTVTKPTVEISIEKVHQILKKANITVQEGEAYVLYHCGHVFKNTEDPQILTYYMGQNRSIRSCPICITEQLLTKYKLCGCGAEHIGKRIQSSKCCGSCPSLRKATGRVERLDAYKRNKHLADESKIYCIHRAKCINKYREYDAIPCKNCNQYQVHPNMILR